MLFLAGLRDKHHPCLGCSDEGETAFYLRLIQDSTGSDCSPAGPVSQASQAARQLGPPSRAEEPGCPILYTPPMLSHAAMLPGLSDTYLVFGFRKD